MIVLLILSLKAVQRQFPNALLHWEDFGVIMQLKY